MQHCYHTLPYMFPVCKSIQGLPYTCKQCIVYFAWPVERQPIELLRQGKYKMVIRAGQQISLPVLYPFFPFMPLAFWTMAVTAAVIADAHGTAVGARVYMATQCCCTALLQRTQCFLLMDGKMK